MTKFNQNPENYSFFMNPVVIAEENVSTNGDSKNTFPKNVLVDNNLYWESSLSGKGGEIIFKLDEGKTINDILLAQPTFRAFILSFSFHGSNDGENWFRLGQVETLPTTAKTTYQFSNEIPFQYYKITVLSSGLNSSTSYYGIRYIELRTALINGVPAYRSSNLNPAIAE
ncbi:discoidin domain-containing protein [Paenibacillus sp. Aloe-11]|uniref:discoidin domain-containing protein n=1 Tax=Paenibacillus sp. Aloe-11 TaxID=1050222 RepID=UPI0002D7679E|nr:discoidin domain-containing protein [Paenibacillus sp. Aloe-11]